MRSLLVSWVLAIGVGAGCGGETYLVVTVDAPPAVHDVVTLEVTRLGQDPPQVQMLPVRNFEFPITFSISGLGDSGNLDLAIDALSADNLVVGTGRGLLSLGASEATVHLETTDFVVNSNFEDDQFLAEEADSVGRQLATTSVGDFTATFGTTCLGRACNLFGRRFDSAGVPLYSADADGASEFRISTSPSERGSGSPAIASAGLQSIVVWDFADLTGGASGVACRGIDENGSETAGQQPVTFETAKGVDVAPLPDGNFAVTWLAQVPQEVHMTIVRPNCTSAMLPVVSISQPERDPLRGAHVASNGSALLYAWILGDSVRLRGGTATGELFAEIPLAPPTDFVIEQVRIAAMDTGFGVALRLAARDRTLPGSIVLYRTNAKGELLPGEPTLITAQSGSNTGTGRIGFGIATRGDGATMIVWHQCDDGSSTGCLNRLDVYGRVVRSDGTPAGSSFMVPTTTNRNQRNPSVTAINNAFAVTWIDESMTEPDTSGHAVRARVVYPTF